MFYLLTPPDRSSRSLSPSAEIKDGKKRPAIICDFFAKGWCIRGSSCSFLHIKDTGNNTDQEAEGDLVTAYQKRELKLEEGISNNLFGQPLQESPLYIFLIKILSCNRC